MNFIGETCLLKRKGNDIPLNFHRQKVDIEHTYILVFFVSSLLYNKVILSFDFGALYNFINMLNND